MVEPDMPQVTNITWCMDFACWIKQTHARAHAHTHREYIIFTAFPIQQWLYKHASMLHYTYIASLVGNTNISQQHFQLSTNTNVAPYTKFA